MSDDIFKVYMQCSYCKGRVDITDIKSEEVEKTKCPRCERDSLKPQSPFHFNGIFNAPFYAGYFLTKIKVITTTDNEDMLLYNEALGYYEPHAELFIKDELKRTLGLLWRSKYDSEVLEAIKGRTHISRDRLNASGKGMINLKNKVIDVDNLQVLEHSPDYYFTYVLPVNFNESAVPTNMLMHLQKVFAGNPKRILYILEYLGYLLQRGYPLKKALIMLGVKDTGKTTTLNAISEMFGDTQATISLQALCNDKFAQAGLYGKIVNIYDELPSIDIKSASTFKMITGNSRIRADEKFKKPFDFANEAKQIMATNALPHISDSDDDAFFGRMILIEHDNVFDKDTRDTDISTKLSTEEEKSGMLNLMLLFHYIVKARGYFTYERDFSTEDVRSLWLDYTEEKNEKEFLEAYIIVDPEGFVAKEEIRNKYVEYCKAENIPIKNQATLTSLLKKTHAITEAKAGSRGEQKHGWRGITLIPEPKKAEEPGSISKSYPVSLNEYLNSNIVLDGRLSSTYILLLLSVRKGKIKEIYNNTIIDILLGIPNNTTHPSPLTSLDTLDTSPKNADNAGIPSLPSVNMPGAHTTKDFPVSEDATLRVVFHKQADTPPETPKNAKGSLSQALLDMFRKASPNSLAIGGRDVHANARWGLLYNTFHAHGSQDEIDAAMTALEHSGRIYEPRLGEWKLNSEYSDDDKT